MRGVYQHHTSHLGVLGVQPEHVYGEGDFVGDALAGRLSLGPEFKVAPVVLISLAIQVVYHFIWRQFAAKFLFKNEAMFQHFAPFYAMLVRKTQANVALAGDVALYLARLGWAKALMFGKFKSFPAGRTTQFLLAIYRSAGAALDWHRISALSAIYLPFFVGKLAAHAAAFCRAVKRISAEFISVASEFSGAAHKGVATYFTGERHSVHALNAPIMRVIAGARAEFSHRAAYFAFVKLFSAVQTGLHKTYYFVSEYKYQAHGGMAIARGVV